MEQSFGGLQAPDLIVVGGRPGMGKTGMALVIDDTGGQTPDYIERCTRRLKRRNRVDLLVVDHLQLMRSPREVRIQNRVQQISDFTMRMKALAKELDIPVLLLSQLNRGGERADNKVPQLAHLRDSGSIEQDADSILFLYREAYYLAREEPDENNEIEHDQWDEMMKKVRDKGDAYVAKNRRGPTMKIPLRWVGSTMSYQNPSDPGNGWDRTLELRKHQQQAIGYALNNQSYAVTTGTGAAGGGGAVHAYLCATP